MLQALAGQNGSGQPWMVAAKALLGADAQTPLALSAGALVAGVVVLAWPRNSNVLVDDFRPGWPSGAAVALGLIASVLQLGKVTPFLYFNF
jgi:hypothetical protein